jgi:polysaccharide biosynthesis/export protein
MKTVKIGLAAWLACSFLFADRPAGAPATADPDAYIIQPSDVLEIFVWKEPELSRKVLVRPDGRISFPLVQDLRAAGITPEKLKEDIETELKEYLDSPNVTVVVDSILSYKVFVTGKVQNPGEFVREKPVSVLQALSLAGGFQDYANRNNISVIRKTGQRNQVFDFHYDDVVRGRRPELNITLQPGDVVVVP